MNLPCFVTLFFLTSVCSRAGSELVRIPDAEASRLAAEVEVSASVTLAEGLEARVWAPETLLADPVAIDVTDEGEVWVSATQRRRSSMFDIRYFTRWLPESWSWTTVEERREFLLKELSPENSDRNEWLSDFNEDGSHDWRDLLVKSEEVYRIADRSGDGLADESERFAWIPSSVETDIAGAVLFHEGDVFLGLVPDLWRIQDLDGDGEFETKTSISSGYGIHIGFGGHAISGLKVGPDGRIYWGIGDIGFNGVDQDGKRWAYPRQGVLVRSEPDGSGFEVYAHGLRNVHEFDWDAYGNLIGADNDGDHDGEEERLVYLIDGSDSGWRNNWQLGKYTDERNNAYKVWMDERYFRPRFEGQAAHILPPLAKAYTGPAGLVFQPGSALGGRWRDHFFVASFTGESVSSGVYAYALRPKGASFELERDERILAGITAVGIDFGPDGALYLADWGGGWGVDGIGRVWKVDTVGEASELAERTRELLAADFSKQPEDWLAQQLDAADRRVRLKAQFELVARGAGEALRRVARLGESELGRIHGIWGMGQLVRVGKGSGEALAELLGDESAEIRAQAARTLGDVRYARATERLLGLLAEGGPRIQLMATEALGRIGASEAFGGIVSMLEANDDRDVYLRHAGAIALARIDDGERLISLADHPSAAVRVAAVVALDRLDRPEVSRFLEDPSELIVEAAARAINDEERIESAMPRLAEQLTKRSGASEALVRRAINANLYVGSAEAAGRLAGFAASGDAEVAMRIEAIDTLAVWADPSIYDRVSGRVLPRPDNDVEDARHALRGVFEELLGAESAALRVTAIEAAGWLELRGFDEGLLEIVRADGADEEKVAALDALAEMSSPRLVEAIELALEGGSSAARSAALGKVGSLDVSDRVAVSLLELALDSGQPREAQAAVSMLGELESEEAGAVLRREFQRLKAGEFPGAAALELFEAIERAGNAALKKELADYRFEKTSGGPMERYGASLEGGDPRAGREAFYSLPAAQCIRCHVVGNGSATVGPDLAGVGDRLNRRELLQALVDPSARIAPGFGIVFLTTTDGRSVQGTLVEETADSVTLRIAGEEPMRVRKSQVKTRTNAPSSMPPMGLLLDDRQLRDVVAFLASLKGEADPAAESESGGHQ